MRLKLTKAMEYLRATTLATQDDPTAPWDSFPCSEWPGWLSVGGYGKVHVGQKRRFVHRVAYEIKFGPIPEGIKVLHRCDNPKCFRWSHLWLGTQADNIRDMDEKKRRVISRGESNGRAKLTWEKAQEILLIRRETGLSVKKLALQFGINSGTVSLLVRGLIWKHPR